MATDYDDLRPEVKEAQEQSLEAETRLRAVLKIDPNAAEARSNLAALRV